MGEWNKGTGGGSGLETEFERWADDVEKFDKYGINLSDYDHTDMENRPLILFNLYTKNKEPYLTVIRLWDNKIDNLLCAKYFPIHIGKGEVGMDDDMWADDDASLASRSATSRSNTCSSTSSKKSRKRKNDLNETAIGLTEVMKSITTLCRANTATPVATNITPKKKKGVEHMTLDELYSVLDQYKKQLKFLADMGMLSNDEKKDMVNKTKMIFAEIGKRTNSEVS